MMNIDLGEARAIAQNMKAKYSAFERLEAIITAVEQAQGLVNEKQEAVRRLDAEISVRTAQLSELTNQGQQLKDANANMLASYKKKSEEMDAQYQATRKGYAADLSKLRDDIDQFRAANKDEMVTLTNNKAAVERELAALRQKLADIRASIPS